jgi:hypothetical protein
LIIPKTYGEPVAFLAVPKTELLAAAAVLLDVAEPELLELLEPLELQPAAVSVSTAAAVTLSHLRGFICSSFGGWLYLSVRVSRRRPAQAAVSPR